jgi:Flp pilus assembly protein TadB
MDIDIDPQLAKYISITLSGIATAITVWIIMSWNLVEPDDVNSSEYRFEQMRKERLRTDDVYRLMEGWIQRRASQIEANMSESMAEKVKRDLILSGTALPWKPAEYLASKDVLAIGMGLGGFGLSLFAAESLIGSAIVGILATIVFGFTFRTEASGRAKHRRELLLNRMPFTVDLMALMLEAGSTFGEALRTAAIENRGHPLGDEFQQVIKDLELGRTQREALMALNDRIDDAQLRDLIFAIIKGSEMGTPMVSIFRNQADIMRQIRTQKQEKEAAEAQVAILFPGLIVMCACLLIVVAPFILNALYNPSGD